MLTFYNSVTSNDTSSGKKLPCRSCERDNGTDYICPVPIAEQQQSGIGHILCGFCSEYLPARGKGGTEPDINQCCKYNDNLSNTNVL